MKKYLKIIIGLIILLSFLGTFIFLYQNSKPKPITYREIKPLITDIRVSTILTGEITPRDEVFIKPQISGIIEEIYKKAGDMVKTGEVLAKVKVIPDMGQLSAAQSRLELANINLKQAKTEEEREKMLFDKQLVSAEEYEKYRQVFLQAQQEQTAAMDAIQVIRSGVSKKNTNQSSTLIRATVSGLILDVPIKKGNSVIQTNAFNDGTTIASIANMENLIFNGKVDESDVGKIKVGMPMNIKIGAMANTKLDAVLEYISPKALEVNGARQFEIKAAVRVPGNTSLRSGYSANAEIILASAHQVLTVSESAICYEQGKTYVYVISGSETNPVYNKREVVTGISDGLNIEIKKGITKNDRIRGAQNVTTE